MSSGDKDTRKIKGGCGRGGVVLLDKVGREVSEGMTFEQNEGSKAIWGGSSNAEVLGWE